mmetsp:Transcript_21652/g.40154  ORF Transcript_21652/g.40154 Transcript_21652/m.40154 type:complete len:1062 (-) Transcript_21652:110-3295(-)
MTAKPRYGLTGEEGFQFEMMLPRKNLLGSPKSKRKPYMQSSIDQGRTLQHAMQKVQGSVEPEDNISIHSSDFAITRGPDVGQPFGGEENLETNEDDPYNLNLSVLPDDSISARDVRKRRDAAKMSEREMAELRRLIQGDDRFGKTLERTCQAIFECVQSCNPGPILTLLASLVWRSLCIAWELESNGAVPKAHLRSKISELQGEQRQVQDNFDDCRSSYLKELTVLRDQLRRMSPECYAEIHRVVYEDEPVMYYEPLKYLDEKIRIHVAEVVEEKLKLILSRLDSCKGDSLLGNLAASGASLQKERTATKEALAQLEAAKEKERQMRELYEAMQTRYSELEERINVLESEDSVAEADLNRLYSLADEEWEAVSSQLQRSGEALGAAPWADSSRGSAASLQNRSSALSQSRTEPCLDRSNTLDSHGSHGAFVRTTTSHLRDLLLAEKRARQCAESQLEEKDSALAQSQRETEAAAAAAAAQSAQGPGRHGAGAGPAAEDLERLQKEAAEQARARELAEKSMERMKDELAKLRAQLARERSNKDTDDEWRAEKEEELAKAQALIKELKAEIERLKGVIAEMAATGRMNEKALNEMQLRWRGPTGKVFDRLFQDSIDREERRRALEMSLEQARDEKALEIFKANMLTFQTLEPFGQGEEELKLDDMTDAQLAMAVRRQYSLWSRDSFNLRDVYTGSGSFSRSVAGFRGTIHPIQRGSVDYTVDAAADEDADSATADATSQLESNPSQQEGMGVSGQSMLFRHRPTAPARLWQAEDEAADAAALQISQLLPEMLPAPGAKNGLGQRPSAATSREVSPDTLVSALQGLSERMRSPSPGDVRVSVDGVALSAAALMANLPGGAPAAISHEAGLQLQGRSLNRLSMARERSRSPQLEADRIVTIAPTMAQVLENPRTPPEFEIAQCDAEAIRQFKTPFAASMASAGRLASTPDLAQQVAPGELWRPPLRRSESQPRSRPGSAGSASLRRARETITARPRSAALPALMRVPRPTEAALNREAVRLLADQSGKAKEFATQPLRHSATAPSIRSAALNRASRRMKRVPRAS